LFGVLDGLRDEIAFHQSFKGDPFFDNQLSWCNKWKNCEPGKEKFLFSSNLLVWLTDGFHLVKMLSTLVVILPYCLFVTYIVVKGLPKKDKSFPFTVIIFLTALLLLSTIKGIGFYVFYK
jgi:hypothetical protein